MSVWAAIHTQTGMLRPSGIGASPHNDTVSSIQWLPDGSGFIVTSLDCKMIQYVRDGSRLVLIEDSVRCSGPVMELQLASNR